MDFENRLIFDKVKGSTKTVPFFGHPVFLEFIIQRPLSQLVNVPIRSLSVLDYLVLTNVGQCFVEILFSNY